MDKDYVINPKTGRVVKKTGAVGKKIINASSIINQAVKMKIARKELEKAKVENKPKNNLPELPKDIWKKVLKFVHTKTDKDGFNEAVVPTIAFTKSFWANDNLVQYPDKNFLKDITKYENWGNTKKYQIAKKLIDENKFEGNDKDIPEGYIKYKWGSYDVFKHFKTPKAIEAKKAVYDFIEEYEDEKYATEKEIKERLELHLTEEDIYVLKNNDVIVNILILHKEEHYKKYSNIYSKNPPKNDLDLLKSFSKRNPAFWGTHLTFGQIKN